LNKILFKGVTSKLSATRSIQILLSSHMCSLIIYVNQHLYLERIKQGLENLFTFSDIYNILLKYFQNYQVLEREIMRLTRAIIETSLRKGIYEDLTPDVVELENKKFRVRGRQTNARIIAESTQKKYIEKNAQKLARKSAIEIFMRETGFRQLDSFMNNSLT